MHTWKQSIEAEKARYLDEIEKIMTFLSRDSFDNSEEADFVAFFRRFLTKFNNEWFFSFSEFKSISFAFNVFQHCLDDGFVTIVPVADQFFRGPEEAELYKPFMSDFRPRHWGPGSPFVVKGERDFYLKPVDRKTEPFVWDRSKPVEVLHKMYNNHYITSEAWKSTIYPVFIPGEWDHPDALTTQSFQKMNAVLDWLEKKEEHSREIRLKARKQIDKLLSKEK